MMERSKGAHALAGLLLLIALASTVCAQESILRFTFDPAEPTVKEGGSAAVALRVHNESVYEADDVAVYGVKGEAGFSLQSTPVLLKLVPPFAEAELDLILLAPDQLHGEAVEVAVEVIYTYCVDDVCFQIVEELALTVHVAEDIHPPSSSLKARPSMWRWLVPTLGVGLLAGGVLLWRLVGLTVPLYVVLLLFIGGGLAYGVVVLQHQQARSIGAVLCTSCVGIEESRHESPLPSTEALTALATLQSYVELIVFYAPWCHSCPFAEAMVEQLVAASDRLSWQLINVDAQREIALSHGVIRSGRTIVPAILRVDTGEVIFGVERLEARLLDLLGLRQ